METSQSTSPSTRLNRGASHADPHDVGRSPWRRRLLGGGIAIVVAVIVGAVLAVPFITERTSPEAGAATTPASTTDTLTTPVPDPERDETEPRRKLLPPTRGVYLGVSNHELVAEDGAIRRWERANGVAPVIVNWYQQWLSGERRFRPEWARRVARGGAVPMITWEPWSAPLGERHTPIQPDISLARIAAGDHDAYIRAWARDIAAYGQPVLIRLMHEMNGNWYPWGVHINGNTPADYVAAWRHVHRVFDRAGADNVSWVWSINNLERIEGEDHDIAAYYPGGPFVDWVSTSGFNWGEAYSWSNWRTADPLYRDTYEALTAFDRPIMISEIGTTDIGGDARVWIRQTFQRLRAGYPKLRAVLWYDDIDGAGLDFTLTGQRAGALSQPGALGKRWLQEPRFEELPTP